MKDSLKQSLQIARKRERLNPSNENIIRVRKIIYQAMLNTNKEFAEQYRQKHSL